MLKKVIATLVLLCSCVLLVPCFESKAQTVVGSGSYNFGAGSPEYYTMEDPNTKEFYYEPAVQNIYVNTSLNTSKYYRLFFDWNLSVTFTNHSGSSSHRTNTYLLYNGVKYFFDGRFCSIIVPGNGSNGFGLGLESYINVDQYWGYGTYAGTCSVTAYELSDKEASQYLGVDDIENALERQIVLQEKSNELHEESNTWLEKIFNYLNESQEQQKQEAQTQGNSSVSQGSSAIEDKGAGFTQSLGNLTSSMSYTGTQCAWEFPQVKLPAIAGVMGEIVLIEKQPIDFAVWVNAIPSDILLVVQSLCTAGLIIYCFKELYDTIAYVLTLRKDDNS